MSQGMTGVGRLAGVCVLLAVLGCSSNLPRYTTALPPLPPSDVVRLAPGDELEIKFQYVPELDDQQVIRPDGRISLAMVDEVMAAGLTPAQLDQKLTELYAEKLKDPVITVIVRKLAAQRVYVGGEVKTAGMIELVPGMSLLEALIAAGGPVKESADLSNVVIVRHVNGTRHMASVDLAQQLKEGVGPDVVLAPRDIVLIPRTGIDRANQWVDQHINRLVPRADWAYLFVLADN